jgi:hypothetical protein
MFFTRLCWIILFIKIKFLFNQMIIDIDTHEMKLIESKRKKNYVRLHIIQILSKNKYFIIYTKHKKKIINELE